MSEECRVLTKEQYDEMFRRINELEQNLAGAEQSVQEGLEINEELKAENKKLKEKIDIAVKAIVFFIYPVSCTAFKGSDAVLKEFRTGAKNVLKQIKELK